MNIINASKNHIFLIKIELINIVVVLSCKNLAKEYNFNWKVCSTVLSPLQLTTSKRCG